MTVATIPTDIVGTFAYIQPATSIQLADALPYFNAYQQYAEYVDGVMRIYDTGSQSVAPNNYCDCYVRIRTDGWMMAFFPEDAEIGNACWSPHSWILDNYNNRGDLVWWGHTSSASGNPTTNATRLGRALAELWEVVKTNSDNPSYVFDYADVGYYDYEHTTSTKIYIFGRTGYASASTYHHYYYFTIPVGTTIQCSDINYGFRLYSSITSVHWFASYLKLNEGTANENILYDYLVKSKQDIGSNQFYTQDKLADTFTDGVQNVVHLYLYSQAWYNYVWASVANIIFADG